MFRIFEKAFIVVALIYFAAGLMLVLQPDDLPTSDEPPSNASASVLVQQEKQSNSNDPTEKNKVKLAFQLGLYMITAALITCNLREFMALIWKHKLLLLLLALALVSATWSDEKAFTFRRSLVLIASTCFGVYLGSRYTMREILRLVCIAGIIAAIASYLLIWRKPDLGISSGVTEGDWQGIFSQKNTLGRFMALEVLFFFIGAIAEKKWRGLYIVGGLFCLPLLIMAKDATALLSVPLLFACLLLFQMARRRSLVKMVALISAVSATAAGIVFLIIIEPRKLLLMMGKDTTFSGRTDIWAMVWQKFLDRPWFGYGYSAFWMGKDGKQSADIWEALHWSVPHSHNGFLDVLVQVGVVGLALFFVGYAVFFWKALRCARASKSILGLIPLMYLSFMLLFNFSEGSIIREESMFWVLYAALWVLTTRWLGLAEAAARQPAPSIAPRARAVVPAGIPAWRFESSNSGL